MINLLNKFIEKSYYNITLFIRNNKIKIMFVHIMMPFTGKLQLAFYI